MKPSTITRAIVAHDLGADFRRFAQRVAMVAAAFYVAGMAAGVVVHWLNDWLAGDRKPLPMRWGQSKLKTSEVHFTDPSSQHWQICDSLTVAKLREMARNMNIKKAGGRPVHKAQKQHLNTAILQTVSLRSVSQ
jgi:hypothetical protein